MVYCCVFLSSASTINVHVFPPSSVFKSFTLATLSIEIADVSVGNTSVVYGKTTVIVFPFISPVIPETETDCKLVSEDNRFQLAVIPTFASGIVNFTDEVFILPSFITTSFSVEIFHSLKLYPSFVPAFTVIS